MGGTVNADHDLSFLFAAVNRLLQVTMMQEQMLSYLM